MYMNTDTKQIETLRDAYLWYVKDFDYKRRASVGTAVFRCLISNKRFGLNFIVDPHKRLTVKQKAKALELACQLKLEEFSNIELVLSWQEEVFDMLHVDKQNSRKNLRWHLRDFLEKCQEAGLLKPKLPNTWEVPLFQEVSRYHGRGAKEDHPVTKRQKLISHRIEINQLSEKCQFEIQDFRNFWTEANYGSRPIQKTIEETTCNEYVYLMQQVIGWLILDKIAYHCQMHEYAQARKQKKPEYNSDWLLIDLKPPGWIEELNIKYPPQKAIEATLDNLIPVVDIRVQRPTEHIIEGSAAAVTEQILNEINAELRAQEATLSTKLIFKLGQLLYQQDSFHQNLKKLSLLIDQQEQFHLSQEVAKEAARKVRSLLDDFIKWLKYQHNPMNNSDGFQICALYEYAFSKMLMSIAKYRYREITDSIMKPNFTDIAVVMELRAFNKEARNRTAKKQKFNPVKHNPTWKELGDLLKILLTACAPRTARPKRVGDTMGYLRKQTAVAWDFQRYLVVMFVRIIAPDRQEVIRKLRQHHTLKLCWLDRVNGEYEEAPWNTADKKYEVFYNSLTKLYYLDPGDVWNPIGNIVESPIGKSFEWIVDLDQTATKIRKENAYRVPKIYNPELQAWLYGRKEYSHTWQGWPTRTIAKRKEQYHSTQQYNWCGHVEVETGKLSGFRDVFSPNHDFVFTQRNNKPFSCSRMASFYDGILWAYFGCRGNIHGVRKSATNYFKRKGMTAAQKTSLATIKNHSEEMQDSTAYTELDALDATEPASQMIVSDFLEQHGLDPDEFGLAHTPNTSN